LFRTIKQINIYNVSSCAEIKQDPITMHVIEMETVLGFEFDRNKPKSLPLGRKPIPKRRPKSCIIRFRPGSSSVQSSRPATVSNNYVSSLRRPVSCLEHRNTADAARSVQSACLTQQTTNSNNGVLLQREVTLSVEGFRPSSVCSQQSVNWQQQGTSHRLQNSNQNLSQRSQCGKQEIGETRSPRPGGRKPIDRPWTVCAIRNNDHEQFLEKYGKNIDSNPRTSIQRSKSVLGSATQRPRRQCSAVCRLNTINEKVNVPFLFSY